MRSKIIQISSFFEKLINQIDENTLLLIVGDHGMKSNGNHGGDSDEEKDTFLFGFKKNANFVKGYSEHVVAQS
jgi:phosphatidylinositol glycan class O